jgi:hypothetical protein
MRDDADPGPSGTVEVTPLDPAREATSQPGGVLVELERERASRRHLWRMATVLALVLLTLAAILPGTRDLAQTIATRLGPQPQPVVNLVRPDDALACLGGAAWAQGGCGSARPGQPAPPLACR